MGISTQHMVRLTGLTGNCVLRVAAVLVLDERKAHPNVDFLRDKATTCKTTPGGGGRGERAKQ